MAAKQIQPSWRRDLRIYWRSLRLQLHSAMSLRGAFAIQIFGMVLNNSALVIAWLFFFHHFGVVNGWHARELIGVMGISMLVFGIMMLLSVGIMDLPRHVDSGSLDSLLTKPSPLLLQLASGNIDVTAFGDTSLGLGIVIWYISTSAVTIPQMMIFLLALFVAMIVFWCFAILLPSTLAFYVFDSERLGRYMTALFMDSGIYPTGVLTGAIRVFLLTIVPGLFMGAIPLEVLYRFQWQAVLFGLAVAMLWLTFSLLFFKRSVQRYESSNLIGAR